MDNREFARLVKREAIDEVVNVAIKKLKSPRSPRAVPESDDATQKSVLNFYNAGALKEQKQAAWFRQLSGEQQRVFEEILHDCAEISALSFCALIDGVGADYDQTFEIRAICSNGCKNLINPANSDMLHDLLSEVCAEAQER
jgi:hypothetical protein